MLLSLSISLYGQNWEGGLMLGGVDYQGDLSNPIFDVKQPNASAGLVIRKNIKHNLAVRANLLFGNIEGSDTAHEDTDWDRSRRNFSFENSITELSLKLEYSPFAKMWDKRSGKYPSNLTPYGFIGLGVSMGKAVLRSDNNNAVFQKNRGQDILDDEEKTSGARFVVPVGGGVKVDLAKKIRLGAEMGFRPTFNDYLDGVSMAGNSDRNDWYWFGGLVLTFTLADDADKDPLPMITDRDQDGVLDQDDACPDVVGKKMFDGCPDTDNDGFVDSKDSCPEVAGKINGCPDTDQDGIADNEDNCPSEKGTKANNGCPAVIVDSDNDGVEDKNDLCPNVAGAVTLNGCPDTDGDGVADKNDLCPTVIGTKGMNGCPDTDRDGIADAKDNCPTIAGPASNGGCPGIAESDRVTLDLAVKNIRFETSSAVLKYESFVQLDKVVTIMNKYPSYSVRINGYTDNVGNSDSNQRLSERRAKACFDFFTTKGISASRMVYKGYGEVNPVADNNTKEGRRLNRRVEFELY